MKSHHISLALVLCSVVAFAQPKITIMTFESYSFEDKITTSEGYEGKIGAGFQYGGGLEFEVRENFAIELIYQRLSTDAYINYKSVLGTVYQDKGTANINYYLLGGTRYVPFNEKISGFGTVDAGLGAIYAKDDKGKDANVEKFCWGGRLGLRISPNDKFSIRIHGQLLSAVQAFGGGLYFGTGGAGAGVSGYSTFWQWNVGGSLNFRIK